MRKLTIGEVYMYSNRIYFIREDNDLTQEDLGNILKVDRSIISKWENGKSIPPIRKINILSNRFNVSFDYIFNLSKNKSVDKINNSLDLCVIGKRIVEIRTKYNLTLRDLAKELNTTSSTISAYETGKNLILTAFALQLCKKYNLSMDWLYGKTN